MECSRLQPAFAASPTAMTAGLRYHASIPLYFQDKPLGHHERDRSRAGAS